MSYAIGVAVFALGIVISLALHEYGHFGTARMFGMKATRFFIGFGPTLWSFRRGETEYGLKGIPAGAFVKIEGMTPDDDELGSDERHRAMWRFPVWKRSIVMGAGSVTHFILGFALLWGVFAFAPVNDFEQLDRSVPQIATVADCTVLDWEVDPATGLLRDCTPEDPRSAAAEAGIRPGDTLTSINGQAVTGWDDLTTRIRDAGGEEVSLTFERDGEVQRAEVALPLAERLREGVETSSPSEITEAHLEEAGVLGVTPVVPRTVYGPVDGVGAAADQTVLLAQGTVEALSRLPEKIPALWEAVTGGPRDPETPMSVVGASRVGGELWERGELPTWLVFLAAVNFFVGVFNLLPLLPLDGGHIAISWFERARSWVYARLGKPDPGRVDYYKLMPLTYVVILIFGGFFLLTVAADIVNPVQLPF